MKETVKEYYHIPENGKINEKVFLTRIGVSLALIVFCMFAMAFAAYGFFSADTSSYGNIITSARYGLDITGATVTAEGTDGDALAEVNASDKEFIVPGSTQQYQLAEGTYRFTLTKQTSEDIASTGYCKIVFNSKSGNTNTHYTQQIGAVGENEAPVDSRTVTIKVTGESVTVDFVPSWGNATYTGDRVFDENSSYLTIEGVKTIETQSDTTDEESNDGQQPAADENADVPSGTEDVPSEDSNVPTETEPATVPETDSEPETETEPEPDTVPDAEDDTGDGTSDQANT